MRVVDGLAADHESAVNIWRSANVARLLPPGVDWVARIREKLADPHACLVIWPNRSGRGRAGHGIG